jgi:hypothetical protein
MGWATFWANFSQTHQVTLREKEFLGNENFVSNWNFGWKENSSGKAKSVQLKQGRIPWHYSKGMH